MTLMNVSAFGLRQYLLATKCDIYLCLIHNGGGSIIKTFEQESVESLSNEDGNVNENVTKQLTQIQNTITSRGNATTWPLVRRRLSGVL